MLRRVWPSFTKSQNSCEVRLSPVAESAIKAHLLADSFLGDPNKKLGFGGHLHFINEFVVQKSLLDAWGPFRTRMELWKGWHGTHAACLFSG